MEGVLGHNQLHGVVSATEAEEHVALHWLGKRKEV